MRTCADYLCDVLEFIGRDGNAGSKRNEVGFRRASNGCKYHEHEEGKCYKTEYGLGIFHSV